MKRKTKSPRKRKTELDPKERAEFRLLLARLRLEESEEADCVERARTGIQQKVGTLIKLIRQVTHELDDENEKPVIFLDRRTKKLCELTAKDVPPGMDPEDVATDCQN
jgi:hypothetical protein